MSLLGPFTPAGVTAFTGVSLPGIGRGERITRISSHEIVLTTTFKVQHRSLFETVSSVGGSTRESFLDVLFKDFVTLTMPRFSWSEAISFVTIVSTILHRIST